MDTCVICHRSEFRKVGKSKACKHCGQTVRVAEPLPTRLELPYPPSANRYWRHYAGKTVISTEARDYKQQVGMMALAARVAPFSGDVSVTIDLYRPAKRGDLDNFAKVLLDSMQGHLFRNDNQVVDLHMRRHDDKKNPRVVIEVKAVNHG
jgi:crossover junction endodeoxyribonuclease RusA